MYNSSGQQRFTKLTEINENVVDCSIQSHTGGRRLSPFPAESRHYRLMSASTQSGQSRLPCDVGALELTRASSEILN
jgi:hypothetical protein